MTARNERYSPPWHQSGCLVVLALLFIFPLGLYGVWKQWLDTSQKWAITVATLAAFAALFIGVEGTDLTGRALPPGQPAVALAQAPAGFQRGIAAAGCEEFTGQTKPSNPRLFRFQADIDFGEAPPSQVVASGGAQASARSYLRQAVNTREVDRFTWRGWWNLGYIVLGFAGLVLLFREDSRPSGYTEEGITAWGAKVAVLLVLAVACGYLAGSRFSIDNATERRLQVRLNGRPWLDLPPAHYVSTRIGGRKFLLELAHEGKVVESASIALDAGLGDSLKRAFWGRGAFVYNVAAANTYSWEVASYMRVR